MSSMYKAHRLVAETTAQEGKIKSRQKLQAATSEVPYCGAARKSHHSQHPSRQGYQRHQKQRLQHSSGVTAREPLRQQQCNSQLQLPVTQRRCQPAAAVAAVCKKRPQPADVTRHGSTLESVTDAEDAEESEEAQALSQKPKPCLDRGAQLPADLLDVDQCGHCTMVSAYAKDIFVYLAEQELRYAIPSDFLAGQAEVTERSRTVLVDWLLQLSSRLGLQADTYHLGVRLLDIYLTADRNVAKRQLQLLGATALWLASKFEEVYSISTGDLLHVCAGACNRRELLAMEVRLVTVLDFRLLPPLPITFLRRLSKVAGVDNKLHYAAKYLLELATLCARLACRPASQLAAAAMRVALGASGRAWPSLLVFYSGYGLDELRPAAADLARACLRAAAVAAATTASAGGKHHRFVYHKYRGADCFAVSACPQLAPGSQYLAGLIAEGAAGAPDRLADRLTN